MSRSGYYEEGDLDDNRGYLWRGAVRSAIRGKRGQALLREMLTALDEMPVRELIAEELEKDGQVCALGAVGKRRGMEMANLRPDAPEDISKAFDIATALACEIAYVNDDDFRYGSDETAAHRWKRVRAWVASQIMRPTE